MSNGAEGRSRPIPRTSCELQELRDHRGMLAGSDRETHDRSPRLGRPALERLVELHLPLLGVGLLAEAPLQPVHSGLETRIVQVESAGRGHKYPCSWSIVFASFPAGSPVR